MIASVEIASPNLKTRPINLACSLPRLRVEVPDLQIAGDDRQVLDSAVGAASDEDLVQVRPLHLAQVLDIVDRRMAGNLWLERFRIDLDHLAVLRTRRMVIDYLRSTEI